MAIRCWTPLASVPGTCEALGAGLFRVGPAQYLVALPSEEHTRAGRAGPLVRIALWAPSDGAARRAFEMAVEADDSAQAAPPRALLLAGEPTTFGAVLEAARRVNDTPLVEWADYRIATDGAFVHRTVCAHPLYFHFRQRAGHHDPCYAIEYRLPGGPGTVRH